MLPSVSHPSRVRGLKQGIPENRNAWHASHPSRVRGLKQTGAFKNKPNAESHPSRVRGLKHFQFVKTHIKPQVAPLAGAWIETLYSQWVLGIDEVAPLAGAWIETSTVDLLDAMRPGSHPSRVRGLKQQRRASLFTGKASHPSRVRGLKRVLTPVALEAPVSHPSRVRGLKPGEWG